MNTNQKVAATGGGVIPTQGEIDAIKAMWRGEPEAKTPEEKDMEFFIKANRFYISLEGAQ